MLRKWRALIATLGLTRTGRVVFTTVAAVMILIGATVALGGNRAVSSAGSCNGNPPPRTINEIQTIQFKLMEKSSFNYFDGSRVVRALRNHRRLWCGVVMDTGDGSLLKLRDISDNGWNVDTVYILSSGADDLALAELAQHWNADARTWVSGSAAEKLLGEAGRPGSHPRILEVWWD
jgi:hypothetical protein